MRFTASILGWSLDLSLEPTTEADDPAEPEAPTDPAAPLSGGLLASTALDTGPTDRYMGFTGGWESDDDDE